MLVTQSQTYLILTQTHVVYFPDLNIYILICGPGNESQKENDIMLELIGQITIEQPNFQF